MSDISIPKYCPTCSRESKYAPFGMKFVKCREHECSKDFVWRSLALDDALKQLDVTLFKEMNLEIPTDHTLDQFTAQFCETFLKEIVLPLQEVDEGDTLPLSVEEQTLIQTAYKLYFDTLLHHEIGRFVYDDAFRESVMHHLTDVDFMSGVKQKYQGSEATIRDVVLRVLLRQSEHKAYDQWALWSLSHGLMKETVLLALTDSIQNQQHDASIQMGLSGDVEDVWSRIRPLFIQQRNQVFQELHGQLGTSESVDADFKVQISYFIAGLCDLYWCAPEPRGQRTTLTGNEEEILKYVLDAIFAGDFSTERVQYFYHEMYNYYTYSEQDGFEPNGSSLDVSFAQSLCLSVLLLERVHLRKDILAKACKYVRSAVLNRPIANGRERAKFPKGFDTIVEHFNASALSDNQHAERVSPNLGRSPISPIPTDSVAPKTSEPVAASPEPSLLESLIKEVVHVVLPDPEPIPKPASTALTMLMGEQEIEMGTSRRNCNARWIEQYFGDDARFWSTDAQFDLLKIDREWFVVPNMGATNDTMLNGRKVTTSTKLFDGDVLGVGKESKGIVKTPMTIRLPHWIRTGASPSTPTDVPAPKPEPVVTTPVEMMAPEALAAHAQPEPSEPVSSKPSITSESIRTKKPIQSEELESPATVAMEDVPTEPTVESNMGIFEGLKETATSVMNTVSSTLGLSADEPTMDAPASGNALPTAIKDDSEPVEAKKEWTPPELELYPIYSTSEAESEMVQRLTERRQYFRENLDWLTTQLQDWQGLLSKMAFVSESQKTRQLDDIAQGILVLRPADFPEETDVWFVGDVHGDLLGFLAVLDAMEAYSQANERDFKTVFMGDLVDDGHDMNDIVFEVVDRIIQHPGRYVWVAGNHDEAVYLNEGQFTASVHPAGYADWLNEKGTLELGEAYIHLVENLPRAILFPKGLMCSHAGFPQDDVSEAISKESDASGIDVLKMLDDKSSLVGKKAQQDFVWCRVTKNPKRRVNRLSKGAQVGARNFDTFSEALTPVQELTGAKLNWIVRGHDHCDESQARWNRVDNRWWGERFLTINNMSFDMRNTGFACPHFNRYPVIARWNSNPEKTPFPVPRAVVIPETLVRQYAPLCEAHSHSSNPRYDGFFANQMDASTCTGMIEVDGEEKVCGAPIIRQ